MDNIPEVRAGPQVRAGPSQVTTDDGPFFVCNPSHCDSFLGYSRITVSQDAHCFTSRYFCSCFPALLCLPSPWRRRVCCRYFLKTFSSLFRLCHHMPVLHTDLLSSCFSFSIWYFVCFVLCNSN